MPKPFSHQTIMAAKSGDNEALAKILRYYDSYISSLSKRPFYDEYGSRYDLVDEEIRRHIESRLMYQIVYKFDPHKIPSDETLEID